MLYLKADVGVEVLVGPVVAVGDGFTPVTTLTIAGADEAELIKFNGATALVVDAISGTLAAITGADGYYTLDLLAAEVDTEGFLVLLINDDSLILPIHHEFMVVNANVYDSMFAVAGTDKLQVDVIEQVGTTVPAPATAGIPDVNVREWLDTAVAAATAGTPDVNATRWNNGLIPAQGVTGVPEVDVTHQVAGLVPTPFTTGVPDTNVQQILDTTVSLTGGDLDVNVIGGVAPLGTAMRGTDSAALASVATEARLAELDAANIPSDVDAILADTGTDGVVVNLGFA